MSFDRGHDAKRGEDSGQAHRGNGSAEGKIAFSQTRADASSIAAITSSVAD
jgi:hypothetical protein